MGVRTGECSVVVGIVACDAHDWAAEGTERNAGTASEQSAAAEISELVDEEAVLGEYDRESVCDFFGITETELGATTGGISDLVRERVALLVVER
jgi:KEOPS complex subunit Cgi121